MKKRIATWIFLAATTASLSARAAEGSLDSLSASPDARTIGTVEKADKIIGREVRNHSNMKIGKVDDLAIDLDSGRVIYAVISVGGFLGVGDRLVPVPLSAITGQGKQLRIDVDKQKLMDAPQFSKDDTNQLSPAYASAANTFFGQSNGWWQKASGETVKPFGNAHKASDLPGMDVNNVSHQKIGDVENVMVDLKTGRVPFVIFSPDSSLNLKNDLYPLPPNTLTPSSDPKSLITGIDQEKLAAAPHFTKNNWPDMSDRVWGANVYGFYGKQAYFGEGLLQPTSTGGTNSPERIYHEPQP